MLNKYPLWKYILIAVALFIGALYALPNIYGSDPAIQISATRTTTVNSGTQKQVEDLLGSSGIAFRGIKLDKMGLLLRFDNVEDQLKGSELLRENFGDDYTVALNIASAAPGWLESINASPMYLGLDLRGGLHFLMEVDMETVLAQARESYVGDLRSALRKEKIRALSIAQRGEGLELKFRTAELRDRAVAVIRNDYRDLAFTENDQGGAFFIQAQIKESAVRELQKNALKQNVTTLRNRVNEIGVAEPVIQQQGDSRIVVQLPGIQDSAHAKKILSTTATLEYRMVDSTRTVQDAKEGRAPGSRIYKRRDGSEVLLKKRIIITGERINSASSGFDQDTGGPAVFINLDSEGARRMGNNTKKNLGKPMAVVFIEYKPEIKIIDGKEVIKMRKVEEVISVATIQGVFSKRFQTTGLDSAKESQNLALLLRAGALAAPIRIIEERTIGPSLGQDNIDKGTRSVVIGMIFVLAFMVFWYRGFGLVANLALLVNLVLIVAVLSMLQATLTLPGIAGIVLTVGMAVDANVLIFERIREELRNGNTPQSSISAGYEKALSTIADANITTLIAAVVLFVFGTGPIKGFAITLSIGILTSMFTAIMGTRAVVNLFVSGRKISKLSI